MDATNQHQVETGYTGRPVAGHGIVAVTVSYLPAPNPFRREFPDKTTIGTVRDDAMRFFGVNNHTDRDTHEFFLEFEGRRLTDMGETLERLLGRDRREAHFNLVEQVTKGAM